MIGSSTYFVRENGKLCAHVGQNYLNHFLKEYCDGFEQTTFEYFTACIKDWGKPNADDLTEGDVADLVSNIVSPTTTKLVGDRYLLVDMDAGKFFEYAAAMFGEWEKRVNDWVEIDMAFLEEYNRRLYKSVEQGR